MITGNEVYTHLENDIASFEAYCTQGYDRVPKSLPCVFFNEERHRGRSRVTLDYSDKQVVSTVNIEVYGYGNIRPLVDAIEDSMNGMYYIEEMCMKVDNADPDINRYSMRFSRVICEGDVLTEDEMSEV